MMQNVIKCIKEPGEFHTIRGKLYQVYSVTRWPESAELILIDECGFQQVCRWEMFKGMVRKDVPGVYFSLLATFFYEV